MALDITESSSSYTYETSVVTAITGTGTSVTYTSANHPFSVGDVIDVVGANISGYNVTNATVVTRTATQFTVTNSATGTFVAPTAPAAVVAYTSSSVTPNIDAVLDLTYTFTQESFQPTDVGYDVSIANIPFILNINNQNPYRRETAQYKKDQFDNSAEPGEQSLTGWWVRSQTSWHNGAGIEFYEPGTDYQHVSHRFKDSRGVDVWNIGELRLHKDVFHAYTGASGINAIACNDGTNTISDNGDCLVSGNSLGILEKIKLNGNSTVATPGNYVKTATSYPDGHNGSNFPFVSVATDGTSYWAVCSGGIHKGTIGTLASDVLFARHNNSAGDGVSIHYAKGFIFFGENNTLRLLDSTYSSANTHSGAFPTAAQLDSKTHIDSGYVWNGVSGGPNAVYASGSSKGRSEIWKIGFDTATSGSPATLLPDLAGATVAVELPFGEIVYQVKYYLSYLIVGTSRGVRICPINVNGDVELGPLLIESRYAINAFAVKGTSIYCATKTDSENGLYTHAALIRIDLSQQFDDGTFAYAWDLEYQSSIEVNVPVTFKAVATTNVATLTTSEEHLYNVGNEVIVTDCGAPYDGTFTVVSTPTPTTFTYAVTSAVIASAAATGNVTQAPDSSECKEVYNLNDRLVMITEEDGKGELQVEHTTRYRSSGYLQTGKIRFGTVEPKFFKYLQTRGLIESGDSISVQIIDSSGNEFDIINLDGTSINENIQLGQSASGQEFIAIKYTLNNGSPVNNYPILQSYQLKAVPGVPRQRIYQFPLSCYDIEMDKYNTQYGYAGRAYEVVQQLEELEAIGNFVLIKDFRTEEQFEGVIEEIRFTAESSPDKDSNGFGGILIVTVRKL